MPPNQRNPASPGEADDAVTDASDADLARVWESLFLLFLNRHFCLPESSS